MKSLNEWKKIWIVCWKKLIQFIQNGERKTCEEAARKRHSDEKIERSLLDLESVLNCLEAGKRLLMMTSKKSPSCSSQTTMNGGRILDISLRNIPPMYLGFELNVEKGSPKYCNRKVSEQVPFILRIRRNWKRRRKEGEEMGIRAQRRWEDVRAFRCRFWNVRYIRSIRTKLVMMTIACEK